MIGASMNIVAILAIHRGGIVDVFSSEIKKNIQCQKEAFFQYASFRHRMLQLKEKEF
jgi:hypothetical protein